MYCPKCSQEQLLENISYCSRCGFLLTAVAEVVENNGHLPKVAGPDRNPASTPRKKGLKQGLFILLLSLLLSPILMIFAKEMQIRPAMFILSMIILLTVGMVRMIYAKMFESNEPEVDFDEHSDFQTAQNLFGSRNNAQALPPAQTAAASDFSFPAGGKWRETNELAYADETEKTTDLLTKDE